MTQASQHKAGRLKQTNKPHKAPGGTRPAREKAVNGRVSSLSQSKPAALRAAGGGAAANASHVTNCNATGAKQARLNRQKQIMADKRMTLFKQRRQETSSISRVIAVVPLSVDVDISAFHAALRAQSHEWTEKDRQTSNPERLSVSYNCKSQRCGFTFISDPTIFSQSQQSTLSLLEVLAVCDSILFLGDYDEKCMTHPLIDKFGEKLLTLISSYGNPGGTIALFNSSSMVPNISLRINLRNPPKFWRSELDRVNVFLAGMFGEESVKMLDVLDHSLARCISDVGKNLRWRASRSYLVTQEVTVVDDQGAGHLAGQLDPNAVAGKRGKIIVTGCLRGVPLFAHSLVHICGVGAVKISRISQVSNKFNNDIECIEVDPSLQDDLAAEAQPDTLLGEQTWPEDHELIHDNPNDYHDDEGDDDEMKDGDEEEEGDDYYAGIEQIASQARTVYATTVPLSKDNEEEYKNDDYVDAPEDRSARERFARYRALQSFRSSYWHPKENLPFTYAKIFQFDDIKGMQKSVSTSVETVVKNQMEPLVASIAAKKQQRSSGDSVGGQRSRSQSISSVNNDNDDEMAIDEDQAPTFDLNSLCVANSPDFVRSDQLVAIELDDVPLDMIVSRVKAVGQLSLFGLHRHENKVSVLHFNIRRVAGFDEVIKSKTPLLIHNGFRSFLTKPIFSESNLNCDKHKFCRFLPPDGFSVASCIGPVTMTPNSPIMVFKPSSVYAGQYDLVATGNILSIDLDRIMLKKIILFGNPIRVRKRTAVVKHMFFDPLDVRWFKPAELVTLQGLRGHIKESVGTHGLFKALFSGPIKQNDQVLLVLYKRVFPKIPTIGELVSSGFVSHEEGEVLMRRKSGVPSVDMTDCEKSSVIVK